MNFNLSGVNNEEGSSVYIFTRNHLLEEEKVKVIVEILADDNSIVNTKTIYQFRDIIRRGKIIGIEVKTDNGYYGVNLTIDDSFEKLIRLFLKKIELDNNED